jgi:hypothetical protein
MSKQQFEYEVLEAWSQEDLAALGADGWCLVCAGKNGELVFIREKALVDAAPCVKRQEGPQAARGVASDPGEPAEAQDAAQDERQDPQEACGEASSPGSSPGVTPENCCLCCKERLADYYSLGPGRAAAPHGLDMARLGQRRVGVYGSDKLEEVAQALVRLAERERTLKRELDRTEAWRNHATAWRSRCLRVEQLALGAGLSTASLGPLPRFVQRFVGDQERGSEQSSE